MPTNVICLTENIPIIACKAAVLEAVQKTKGVIADNCVMKDVNKATLMVYGLPPPVAIE